MPLRQRAKIQEVLRRVRLNESERPYSCNLR